MRKIKNILIIFTLVFIYGCEEEILPPDFQDVTWSMNTRPGAAQVVKLGGTFSFRDLSQGALSHMFFIEEGNKYLYPGFGEKDSLELFINKELDLTSTNKDAHVLFLNKGVNKVKLRNTFKDSLAYFGSEPIPAFKEDGVWVIENTWEIDVYGPLKPAFKVLDKNGNELINVLADSNVLIEDESTWPVIQVEAGDALTYVDLTTEDRPTSRAWSLPKGKPNKSTESSIDIGYFSLGKFTAGQIQSIREGDEVPDEKQTKLIPLIIEVIPSSQPFVFNEAGGIKQNNDDSITFGVTGEIEPFLNEEGNFKVHVVNNESEFNQDIPVLSATINSTDATQINLVLSETVYNTDEITVSYTGGGITSVDTRVLEPFGPKQVSIALGGNIINDPKWSFETVHNNPNAKNAGLNGFWVGNKNVPFAYFNRTMEKFSSGEASLKYSTPPSGVDVDITITGYSFQGVVPGSYKVSYKVYLEAGNTMKGFFNTTPVGRLDWDIETLPRGEWVEISQIVEVPEPSGISAGGQYNLTVNKAENPGVVGQQVMYLDELSWVLLEKRI
ncbi:hypothetical protein [Wenyingzhuangia sp. 2_MG-2023]|uniref:hypothetical protein n=1 Tax=Wenyingzhuangia sp. 2_MG-2023 TaxID=3062639 RepID=UPI0026E28750|nr:hypothetical protein [Wenyingzhuangia sp. 2_MG-2023]MDO6738725.1 hypothetical protein [Wenyingzhuangia sp. 2_MG-2023]MDO6803012.1 hypothetical protein [Wenyingzhuangia sp. 1_MG-2023]